MNARGPFSPSSLSTSLSLSLRAYPLNGFGMKVVNKQLVALTVPFRPRQWGNFPATEPTYAMAAAGRSHYSDSYFIYSAAKGGNGDTLRSLLEQGTGVNDYNHVSEMANDAWPPLAHSYTLWCAV